MLDINHRISGQAGRSIWLGDRSWVRHRFIPLGDPAGMTMRKNVEGLFRSAPLARYNQFIDKFGRQYLHHHNKEAL